MKTNVVRVVTILLSLCILINISYQVYLKFSSPYGTDVAYEYTLDQSLPSEGVIFKNETPIENTSAGVVKYLYSNADKVAVQANVAQVYQNENDVSVMSQIDALNEQIALLNEAQTVGGQSEMTLSVVEQQINNRFDQLIGSIEHREFADLYDQRNDMALSLNQKQLVTKKVENYSDIIAQLSQQKTSLEGSVASQPTAIQTPVSGYFVDSVDGYEASLTLEYAQTITPAELQALIQESSNQETNPNAIGKVITQLDLRYLTLLPAANIATLSTGQVCSLRFEELNVTVKAEVARIDLSAGEDQGLIAFRITEIPENLTSARRENATVILDSYSGLRVPKTAVRTVQDQTGVFIVYGANMMFRKIDVSYENEDYAICRLHPDESEYLQLYDTMIVKGKDLYDGKPIR